MSKGQEEQCGLSLVKLASWCDGCSSSHQRTLVLIPFPLQERPLGPRMWTGCLSTLTALLGGRSMK